MLIDHDDVDSFVIIVYNMNTHTHTIQHSHQPNSMQVHNKISKTNYRCKVLWG